jgi:hypothetical protein
MKSQKVNEMAKQKGSYTRRSNFSGARPNTWYVECVKNCYNAADETFYDAIKFLKEKER